jgi:coenzyme Q-binding protein COQ10
MFSFSKSIKINAPIEIVYEVLTDFQNYRQLQTELRRVKVVSQTETRAEVKFSVRMILQFKYKLNFKLEPNKSIKWELKKGEFQNENSGYWRLKSLEKNLTSASFKIDIDFPFWLPTIVLEGSLEDMMDKMVSKVKKVSEKAAD